jgi:hypothetical protein
MAFFLKRDGNNVPLEVQRWQYFLLRNRFAQTGRIDGQFGLKTENATKFFQVQRNIAVTGELDAATLNAAKNLGYTVKPDNYYDGKDKVSFPAKPAGLSSPTNAARNAALGCYQFKQLPLANRADPDEIVILASCDNTIPNWRNAKIVTVSLAQPIFATGFNGTITGHVAVVPHIVALFAKWEKLDLLHLVRAFDGDFSPRYKRGKSPSKAGHGIKRSDEVSDLSNHAFGSALDIDAGDNPFDTRPALVPSRGAVRELVEPANALGFFWGGHFGSPKDGMHFEFADFANL